MFTGIIEAVGTVDSLGRSRLAVRCDLAEVRAGDSVAVNGVCLTARGAGAGGRLEFDVSPETLTRTTLGALAPGDPVNLEQALRLCDRLGGHLVTGHVDAPGRVSVLRRAGNAVMMEIVAPPELAGYLVPKGSVAVEGVSLTVAVAAGGRFTVALVPQTIDRCNLGRKRPGAAVNIEIDILARYLRASP